MFLLTSMMATGTGGCTQPDFSLRLNLVTLFQGEEHSDDQLGSHHLQSSLPHLDGDVRALTEVSLLISKLLSSYRELESDKKILDEENQPRE